MSNLKRTAPIRPEEVNEESAKKFPSFVIESVNYLIVKEYEAGRAVLNQSDVINEILRRDVLVTRQEIFERKWLDFELIYQDAGWLVRYVGPEQNEAFEPYFEFRKNT